jgi:hypothetical protein
LGLIFAGRGNRGEDIGYDARQRRGTFLRCRFADAGGTTLERTDLAHS